MQIQIRIWIWNDEILADVLRMKWKLKAVHLPAANRLRRGRRTKLEMMHLKICVDDAMHAHD